MQAGQQQGISCPSKLGQLLKVGPLSASINPFCTLLGCHLGRLLLFSPCIILSCEPPTGCCPAA
jgi:hypothetical protein